MAIFRQGTNAREYEKITIFDQIISLYLANDARESHSYYGRRIRKPHPSFRMMPVWMTFSDLFKVTIIQPQIIWKWYDIQLYLQWPTNIQSYMIYRTASFSMILNDPYSQFQGHTVLRVDWKCRTRKWRTKKIWKNWKCRIENDGPNVRGGKCRTWKCRTKTPGPENGGPTAGSWLWNLISRHLW